MEISILKNQKIDWALIESEKIEGETGFILSQTKDFGAFKIRKLSFSKNYIADHWCEKGHIIEVKKGILIIEYHDGNFEEINAGNLIVIGDNLNSHKAKTIIETEVLLID